MRNPIHKRLENLESWQHLTFMACLCERMAPNFALFCQMTEQKPAEKTYHNILNLVWEFLTVKEAKINFENQLEKLEEIANSYEGVDKSFAIQAGREIRIMVKPEKINDEEIHLLARDITKKIEEELEYPGQIKVSIIRETRAVEYAK